MVRPFVCGISPRFVRFQGIDTGVFFLFFSFSLCLFVFLSLCRFVSLLFASCTWCRWDKIQVIVDPKGRVGLQFEHSFSDGLCWNRWLGEIWHAMGHMDTPTKWVKHTNLLFFFFRHSSHNANHCYSLLDI